MVIANAVVCDVHHPFEHIARIFVDKGRSAGITDQRQQFVTVFGSPWKSWLVTGRKVPSCCLSCHYCGVNCRRSWRRMGSHVS